MKKAKRFLAVLAAMTTLIVSAMPAYAEDIPNWKQYANEHIINGCDEIILIENAFFYFISENAVAADYEPIYVYYSENECEEKIKLLYNDTDTETREKLENFIKESNIDPDLIIFEPIETANYPVDFYEVIKMFSQHFYGRDRTMNITLSSYVDDNGEKKYCIDIFLNEEELDTSFGEPYYQFARENNIPENILSFYGFAGSNNESILGDANGDSITNVRDCAFIASALATGKADSLPNTADYNKDGKKNVRDAAAISKDLASK